MSAIAVKWADRVKGLSRTQWDVLRAVAASANRDGVCIKLQSKIAADLRLTERTVRDVLGVLEGFGLLLRERRRGRNGRQAANAILLQIGQLQPEISSGSPAGNRPKAGQPEISSPLVYNISTREAAAPEKPQNPAMGVVEFSPCANPADHGDNIILLAGRAGR